MAFTGAHLFGHAHAANAAANNGLGNPPTIGSLGTLTPPIGAGVPLTANTVQGHMAMGNMDPTTMIPTFSRHGSLEQDARGATMNLDSMSSGHTPRRSPHPRSPRARSQPLVEMDDYEDLSLIHI